MSDNVYKPLVAVDADIPYLNSRLDEFCRLRLLDQEEFCRDAVRDADAMLIRTRTRCDRSLLEGSRVKFIATATIGTDQINKADCRHLGIEWVNSPGCNAPAVAQYVWSSILRLGFDPAKHTLGIVGCGNVGSIVAEWGRLLGARILVSDPPLQEAGRTGLPFVHLDELMAESDAVTLHTPYTRVTPHPTHHLAGAREIGLMRPGAILVNAARGPVTDTEPLVEALEQGRIRAVIDCWEGEPRIDRRLLRLADITTFHIAGYSTEGKQRATRMVCEALGRHFGFTPDTSDLAAPYAPKHSLSPDEVVRSFDPAPICSLLRAKPEKFDKLRAAYELRREV